MWLTLLSACHVTLAKLRPERLADLPLLTALIKGHEDLDRLNNG